MFTSIILNALLMLASIVYGIVVFILGRYAIQHGYTTTDSIKAAVLALPPAKRVLFLIVFCLPPLLLLIYLLFSMFA